MSPAANFSGRKGGIPLAVNNSGTTAKQRRRGRAFKPGQSGNPAGRPVGSKNQVGEEQRAFYRLILTDQEYRDNLFARMRTGMAGRMEEVVTNQGIGKEPEQVEMTVKHPQLEAMTPEERDGLEIEVRALLARVRGKK